MKDRTLKILWLSESPLVASGFGRVTREIASRLGAVPGIEMACSGWGYDGWPYDRAQCPVAVYPAAMNSYGQDTFERIITHFEPDVVISLAEIWMIEWLHSHPCRGRFKWIAYLPMDSGPLYPPWTPFLQGTDAMVAMAEFGRAVLEAAMPSLRMDVIPHGVDSKVFRPLPERMQLKAHDRLRGKFVIGCVARNQPRKNIPALVKAFAQLVRTYPEFHLYLHMSPCDVGHDLLTLLRRYTLEGCADVCPPEFSTGRALSDAQLNRVYNFCDVTVLPTMAEGFGLPILESLAAGIPVVATDYGACSELVRGRGELVRAAAMLTTGTNLMEYAVIDEEHLAQRIEFLYRNPQQLAEYGLAGRAFAETLEWDRLIPKWLEVIERVTGVKIGSGPAHGTGDPGSVPVGSKRAEAVQG